MTDTNSLDLHIDTSDFSLPLVESSADAFPLAKVKDDQPTFSVRAARVREAARQAVAAETNRVLESARAKVAEEQLVREQEFGQARRGARASTLKAGVIAAFVAAATFVAGAWAVQQTSADIDVSPAPVAMLALPSLADDEPESAPAEHKQTPPSSEQDEPAPEPESAPSPAAPAPVKAPAPASHAPAPPAPQAEEPAPAPAEDCGDPNDPMNFCL